MEESEGNIKEGVWRERTTDINGEQKGRKRNIRKVLQSIKKEGEEGRREWRRL